MKVCPACCGSCGSECATWNDFGTGVLWFLRPGCRWRRHGGGYLIPKGNYRKPVAPWHGPRVPQAKDVPDELMLGCIKATLVEIVDGVVRRRSDGVRSAGLWTLQCALRPFGWPDKVVLAKLRSMLRRGLIDGCGCGCSGGFTVR